MQELGHHYEITNRNWKMRLPQLIDMIEPIVVCGDTVFPLQETQCFYSLNVCEIEDAFIRVAAPIGRITIYRAHFPAMRVFTRIKL
jgi:hypothetical protein